MVDFYLWIPTELFSYFHCCQTDILHTSLCVPTVMSLTLWSKKNGKLFYGFTYREVTDVVEVTAVVIFCCNCWMIVMMWVVGLKQKINKCDSLISFAHIQTFDNKNNCVFYDIHNYKKTMIWHNIVGWYNLFCDLPKVKNFICLHCSVFTRFPKPQRKLGCEHMKFLTFGTLFNKLSTLTRGFFRSFLR